MTNNPQQSIDEILKQLADDLAHNRDSDYPAAGKKMLLSDAKAALSLAVIEARREGRKEMADKAVEFKEKASFFKDDAEVVLVSSLTWLATLSESAEQALTGEGE